MDPVIGRRAEGTIVRNLGCRRTGTQRGKQLEPVRSQAGCLVATRAKAAHPEVGRSGLNPCRPRPVPTADRNARTRLLYATAYSAVACRRAIRSLSGKMASTSIRDCDRLLPFACKVERCRSTSRSSPSSPAAIVASATPR